MNLSKCCNLPLGAITRTCPACDRPHDINGELYPTPPTKKCEWADIEYPVCQCVECRHMSWCKSRKGQGCDCIVSSPPTSTVDSLEALLVKMGVKVVNGIALSVATDKYFDTAPIEKWLLGELEKREKYLIQQAELRGRIKEHEEYPEIFRGSSMHRFIELQAQLTALSDKEVKE